MGKPSRGLPIRLCCPKHSVASGDNIAVFFDWQALKETRRHRIARAYFNRPVDPDALGIPEYRDIIKVGGGLWTSMVGHRS